MVVSGETRADPLGSAAVRLQGNRESTKRNMSKRGFDKVPHAYVALNDAIM